MPGTGLFFEDLAVRDLSIYAGVHGGDVCHYRDKAGLECDAVIHFSISFKLVSGCRLLRMVTGGYPIGSRT